MIIYILLSILLAAVSSNDCDSSKCSRSIQRYYQTLNCTAVYANESCCPTRFDCSRLYSKRDKCYLNGVVYPAGTRLNGTTVGLPCDRCICQLRAGKASWNCTVLDNCSNWQLVPDKCRRVFMKDTCCPTGIQCEEDPLVTRAGGFVCEVGNTTYLEGQVFDPPGDTCQRCVCQRGFNGSIDGPWCRKKTCNFELRTKAIQDGCAPIFYAHKHCCPIDWRCPSSEDRVIHTPQEGATAVTPGQCRFGKLLLNILDKLFVGDKRCLECTCSVPPHVTCTKKANCQECNPKRCNTPNLDLYRELNCTAIHENGECCPSSFDCSSVYEHKDHCHFGGMLFHHKAELVGSDVGLPCEQCTCHVHDDKAAWSCAIPECFNWPALPDRCHHIVTQDDCCPIGVLCDNNSTKVGTKVGRGFSCKVDGATYFEGHVFEPHGNDKPCKKCICQRGFDGTFEGPWCDKLSCGYELHFWDKIQAGCVPVFAESDECCPIEWQCPSPTDTVIPATSSDLAPTSAQCTFGALRFNFLDMLGVTDHKCLMCTCYVPPILTCVHEPNCQEN